MIYAFFMDFPFATFDSVREYIEYVSEQPPEDVQYYTFIDTKE